jgi:predicted O-methyltransferase YrrM
MKTFAAILTTVFALGLHSNPVFGQAQPDRPARPVGQRPGPGAGPRRGVDRSSFFPAKTLPKDDREKAILEVLEDMDRNQRRGSMSVPVDDGRLLRILTESIGAKHVVEVGTSIGYSSLWFALALERTGGKLTTFEIDPQRAATARSNFKRAGVDKIITLIEGDAHKEVARVTEPIDLLFLDADKEGYLDYLQQLLPKVRPGGLIVAHNIDEQLADPRFIKAITSDPQLESLLVNAGASGISVSVKKR